MKTVIPFVKMVAAGNDFLIVDTLHPPLSSLNTRWRAISRSLCDRHRGIGADGLLVLGRSALADVKMRVFNPDGSEAKMCGNGARCVALYLQSRRRRWGVPRLASLARPFDFAQGRIPSGGRGTRDSAHSVRSGGEGREKIR